MSYIEREAAIKAIENDCSEAVYYTKRDAIDCLLAEPTADVEEVRHGLWVEDEHTYCGAGRCNYKCTVCGEMISAERRDNTEHLYPCCPFCGAKMDDERSGNGT